ncbi:toxin-antitoxin system YwqK family antitoxin [Vibrio panuliri]|uniref:Membrane-binding protein n=1 Tax=Vibrio panuliri TaxID=1381081 RepID=A0ABX3F872_9VIBR|nr:hypothetical protein [Vibrio panuliri]KAB1458301.1 hypothetical protein F7O85_11405 [Vibrio panuliri]OLQ86787.1 hypothetical protein BIY20_02540 [Vibrio panuliri]
MRIATKLVLTLACILISPFAKTEPMWLNTKGELVTSETEAAFYITEEIKQADGLLQFKAYYVGGKTVAFEGTKIGTDLSNSIWVGIFKYYHRNGNLSQIIHLNDKGQTEGTTSYFDENGQLQAQANFVNGLKSGESTTYYESGLLESRVNYVDGKLQGSKLEYHDSADVIKATTKYDDKGRIVSSQEFTIDGELIHDFVATYTDQKVVSDEKKFKDSVVIFNKHIDEISDSKIVEHFDESGKLYSRYEKLNGKEHNRQVHVDILNNVREENYTHGVLHGVYSIIDENGFVKSKGLYFNGNKTGRWEYYYDQIHYIDNYNSDGSKHGQSTARKDNKLLSLNHYHNGKLHGHSESHSKAGMLLSVGSYLNGKRDGHWQYRSIDRSMTWRGSYHQGKRVGAWNAYLDSGHKVAAETYDENGLKDGINYYFFKDSNQVSYTEEYEHGVKNGAFSYYRKNGKPTFTEEYENDVKVNIILYDLSGLIIEE